MRLADRMICAWHMDGLHQCATVRVGEGREIGEPHPSSLLATVYVFLVTLTLLPDKTASESQSGKGGMGVSDDCCTWLVLKTTTTKKKQVVTWATKFALSIYTVIINSQVVHVESLIPVSYVLVCSHLCWCLKHFVKSLYRVFLTRNTSSNMWLRLWLFPSVRGKYVSKMLPSAVIPNNCLT